MAKISPISDYVEIFLDDGSLQTKKEKENNIFWSLAKPVTEFSISSLSLAKTQWYSLIYGMVRYDFLCASLRQISFAGLHRKQASNKLVSNSINIGSVAARAKSVWP